MQKSAIVTGGAGFIGTNLCYKLLNEGYKVYSVDNLYCSPLENSLLFTDNPNYKFIKRDVRSPLINSKEIPQEVNEIYHLASPASIPNCLKDPIFTLETNIIGITNVLNYAKKYGTKVLHASTSEVYGDPLEHPQQESYWGNVNPIGPRSCYDESKRVAETFCKEYQEKYDIDVRIVRIFNTYGPYFAKNDGRVISNFIFQALTNNNLTVYGDGNQTRSFQYIDDLLEGFKCVMELKENNSPYNLGNPNEITINDLTSTMLDLIDTKSGIEYRPALKDDPIRRKPDITKITNETKWEPKVDIIEGLTKTIEYFQKTL